MTTYTINKRAGYDYTIISKYEAGIKLKGFEVKSVRNGHINLKGAYVTIRDGQAWLIHSYIAPYKPAGLIKDYDSERPRVLLLHKREVRYLLGKLAQKGLTLTPLRVYNSNNRVKLEFALTQGKKKYDKRKSIQERETRRTIARTLKSSGG